MIPSQKRRFIRELSKSIRDELLAKAAQMPAEWDGHEIRELFYEKVRAARSPRIEGKRGTSYRNEVLVRNL